MKRYLITFIFFLLSYSICFSQEPIEVLYDLDDQENYNFYCNNTDFCNYTVEVLFTQIFNLKSNVGSQYRVEVRPGRTSLASFSPQKPENHTSIKYSYSYYKGCINPGINLNFTYLLPLGEGKKTKALPMGYLKVNTQDREPKDWYAIGFKMDYGDTVYAARRGIVVEKRDEAKLQLSGYAYSSQENYIEIVHDDCSFGRYQVLSGTLVKLGQRVEAGEPIGFAGGDKYEIGPHIRFSVYYNDEQKVSTNGNDGTKKIVYWAYVPLVFYTPESKNALLVYGKEYTSEHPESIIKQEMSKRQIRNLEKIKQR
ncbi:MAG: M23 family metallopeptidase [Mariniphaga sp.]